MNILVFGKDGQLGKAFKVLFDNLSSAKNLNIQYVGRSECDLSNEIALSNILSNSNADLIINASAYTAVDKAEAEILLAYAINAKAPELMARYAAERGATFLHYSTDYVFDGAKLDFYVEDDARNPLSIYGKSKAAGEEAIEKIFSSKSSGQYAILRTSWVYGEGANFIRTILRLAKEREELRIIHDQHGVPTSARWLAQVSLDLSLDSNFDLRRFPSGIYHAVPKGETTWYGLACLAIQTAIAAGASLKARQESIKPIMAREYPLPAPRPMNSRMGTDKLQEEMSRDDDVSKLQRCSEPWSNEVQAYIRQLAKDGLI